ncbi:MAG: hypothetical protein V4726_02770 [Verrucomicrobiota bacterium]
MPPFFLLERIAISPKVPVSAAPPGFALAAFLFSAPPPPCP